MLSLCSRNLSRIFHQSHEIGPFCDFVHNSQFTHEFRKLPLIWIESAFLKQKFDSLFQIMPPILPAVHLLCTASCGEFRELGMHGVASCLLC